MIIKSITVKKFRGFSNINFKLGKQITVIAGQNGTQKTTLLGMLSQTFSLTEDNNPMSNEKPLSGGNYRSGFAEKFKLSDTFDTVGSHEWTLHTDNLEEPDFTIESILRDAKTKAIRFWKKGDRNKGSGYIQHPVIYLSLSRLFPIGEDVKLKSDSSITLNNEEFNFYKQWHNKILIIPDIEMISADYLGSLRKNTIGANTSFYDWKMNSAGQDNIGKILLSIISFQRLKEQHPTYYQGGILVIDELDATLYPASQIKLLEALNKFSSDLNLQIIFTTHSINLLEYACNLQNDKKRLGQVNVIYMEKKDNNIISVNNISFNDIQHKLNLTIEKNPLKNKIMTFTEDAEAQIFLKCIIKNKRTPKLNFIKTPLACTNLISLGTQRIPTFVFPKSLVVLDGDVRLESQSFKKASKLKNFIILPGDKSPERLLADFLFQLADNSPIWKKVNCHYTKQFVFQNITYNEIMEDRKKAKEWFNNQKQYWGRHCSRIINPWIEQNKQIVVNFLSEFDKKIEQFTKYYDNIS